MKSEQKAMGRVRTGPGRIAAVATAALMLAPLAAHAVQGSARNLFHPPAVFQEAVAAIAPCLDTANTKCITQGLGSFTSGIAAEIDGLPRGRAGLEAWLRMGVKLHLGDGPTVPAFERMPLATALEALYSEVKYDVGTDARRHIIEQIARLSPTASGEMGDLVSAFVASLRLAARARGDSGIERWALDVSRAHTLATHALRSPGDAAPEAHQLLDSMARVDMATIAQASLMIADALEDFDDSVIATTLDIPLVFIGGDGATKHEQERLLLVDRSGDDTYLNNAGGGLVATPLYPVGGSFAADLGAGNDRYYHEVGAQGSGFGGVGILYDDGGTDRYTLGEGIGHGIGYAGIGMLYDVGRGNDFYRTTWKPGKLASKGTNGAGLAGIGLLVDEGGSDVFRQDGLDGIGWGAAGLGLLASLGSGDDTFRSDGVPSASFAPAVVVGVMQAHGEIEGAGIIYDEGGDDRYRCNDSIRQGCQGSASATSLGLLWDRGGDDRYVLEDTINCLMIDDPACPPGTNIALAVEVPIWSMGQGAAYIGLPSDLKALGILYDESGDDRYRSMAWSQGYSAPGNAGVLYDAGGGNDAYDTRAPMMGSRADGEAWIDGLLGIGIDE